MLFTYSPATLRRIRRFSLVVIIGLRLLLQAGCTIGPNFQQPQVQVPEKWIGPTGAPVTQPATLAEKDLARWWTVFEDPTLIALVERAVQSNLDLMQAEARIRQARASRGVAASGMGPTLDATGAYRHSRSPGSSSSGTSSPQTAASSSNGIMSNQYQAGFDAGWELDIFGGVRRNIEAADADLLGSVEARRDVLVTLTAEVARNYIDVRTFQQRIAIAQKNLKAQKHSAELTRQRFQFGFVSGPWTWPTPRP